MQSIVRPGGILQATSRLNPSNRRRQAQGSVRGPHSRRSRCIAPMDPTNILFSSPPPSPVPPSPLLISITNPTSRPLGGRFQTHSCLRPSVEITAE